MNHTLRRAMVLEVVTAVLAFIGLLFTLRLCAGCSPAQTGATAAESAYTAELLRCVDEANTLAESRECRRKVNVRWGIVEKEAGVK